MDFKSVSVLGTGRTNKGQLGTTKDASFDVKFANYTKVNEKGEKQEVRTFAFSNRGMKKLGVESNDLVANIGADADNVYIIVGSVNDKSIEKHSFFRPAKSTAKNGKSKNVSIPSLITELEAKGHLSTDFQGSQYFDIEKSGEANGLTYFQVSQSEVAAKPYNPREKEEVNADEPQSNVQG